MRDLIRRLDERYEWAMLNTRWCPFAVVLVWVVVIGAVVRWFS